MKLLMEILKDTPWWVYLMFIYVLKVGIQSCKNHVLPFKNLFIVPMIFTFLSIHTITQSFGITYFSVTIWSLAALFGTTLGYLLIKETPIKVDREKSFVQVPGTWNTLVIMLVIFGAKYYFSMQLAIDPELANQTNFEFSSLAVTGFCTGIFVGRLICFIYKYKTLKSENLT